MRMRLAEGTLLLLLAQQLRAFGAPADDAVKEGMAALAKDVKEFAALRDATAAEFTLPSGQTQDNGLLDLKRKDGRQVLPPATTDTRQRWPARFLPSIQGPNRMTRRRCAQVAGGLSAPST